MRERRRRRYEEDEEAVELGEVLEPYENSGWAEQTEEGFAQEVYMDPYEQGYEDGYYADEYSHEDDETEHEGRFRIAIGMFDLVSIFVGIFVILLLVAMLLTLVNWLRTDILHSALLLHSGLQ